MPVYLTVCQPRGHFSDLPTDWDSIGGAHSAAVMGRSKVTSDPTRIHYCTHNDYLFHSVSHPDKGRTLQLEILTSMQFQYLQFAHDSPLSGHLGRMKTLCRVNEDINVAWHESTSYSPAGTALGRNL